MIRFCSLGSGSSGNATVVEATSGITTTRLLIDAGFSLRELELRLARAGLEPGDLDAVFVTHEHSDHIGCAVTLAERHDLPVWMSRGTWRAIGESAPPARLGFARDGEIDRGRRPRAAPVHGRPRCRRTAAAALQRRPALPRRPDRPRLDHRAHAREHRRLRRADPRVQPRRGDARRVALSAVAEGPHRRPLRSPQQRRSPSSCSSAASAPASRRLVAAHLSRENNRPEIVREALAACWGSRPADVVIADPALGFGWLSIA